MAVPAWTTARPDWRERIVARESLLADCLPLYPDRAAEALAVFSALQMPDLPMRPNGRFPTLGEVCEPFVFDLVAALFGGQDERAGYTARIKEAMLLISKKNGKSTIAAGIMLTALILNWRDEAELLILAPTKEVAKNSFNPAAAMVRADPELSMKLRVNTSERWIKHLDNNAVLQVVSADSGVVGGKKAGFVLVDELWLFGKKKDAESMLEEATGGQAARPEGFTLYLSTHSDDPPAGVFKAKLDYFRDVRDGVIDDPTCLPMLYEWPEELLEAEAYLDPEMFYVTNPNLGKSTQTDFIARKIAQARAGEGDGEDQGATLQVILSKYLNVEIGLRLRRDRWAAANEWEAAEESGLTLDGLIDRCEVVIVGIDGGGGLDDLFGLSALGRERGSDIWLGWSHAWARRIALDRRKSIAPALLDFVRDGDLTLCDSGSEMVDRVAELAWRVFQSGKCPETMCLALDTYRHMGMLVDALKRAGFDPGENSESVRRMGHIRDVSSGRGISSALETVEFKIHDHEFRHAASRMMRWCVSNVRVTLSGNFRTASKQLSGVGKIDPAMALLHAVKRMEDGPVAAGAGVPASPWEDPAFSMVAA